MNKELSSCLNSVLIENLKQEIRRGSFPGISFKHAMEFILTDGILPESGLPVQSFLNLETWIHAQQELNTASYSTTELKNKTGEILERVLSGTPVRLHRHGRMIAEIRRL